MSLKGSVQSAPPNSRGFDTDTQLTSASAGAFVKAGFTFAIRYLSLGDSESSGDLTAEEAQDILNAGLALMAVQHVPESGWWPTRELGSQYGHSAAHNAGTVGLPAGMNIWLDLEGIDSGASATDVEAYCQAWLGQVSRAQYVPGIYLGYDEILDSEQLDALPSKYYWKSGSDSDSTGGRFAGAYPAPGYCLIQNINSKYEIDGVAYDLNAVQTDNLGNTPLWLTAQTSQVSPTGTQDSSGSSHTGTHADNTSAGSSTTGKSGRAAVAAGFALVAVVMYAAGVFTGPLILPGKFRPEKHSASTPAPAPSSPSPQPSHSNASGAPANSTPSAPAGKENPTGGSSRSPAATSTVKPAVAPPPALGVVSTSEPVSDSSYSLMVGSFSQSENADNLAATLERAGFGRPAVSATVIEGLTWHVVRLGPYRERNDAERVATQLRDNYKLNPSILQADGTPAAPPPPKQ